MLRLWYYYDVKRSTVLCIFMQKCNFRQWQIAKIRIINFAHSRTVEGSEHEQGRTAWPDRDRGRLHS